jgi:hypothetical protein
MLKLDTQLQTPTLTLNGSSPPEHPFHQLIVLIPDDSDYSAAVRKIWNLATASGAQVRLLSLSKDATQIPCLRRGLITMASLLRGASVSVELSAEVGTDWVAAVRRNSHPADLIVCFAEQRAGLMNRPLGQILQSRLDNPIYILSRRSPKNLSRSNLFPQVMTWAGMLGIIGGAFVLQIQIVSMFGNWTQTVLLIVSTIAEAWLIGAWNSLFG